MGRKPCGKMKTSGGRRTGRRGTVKKAKSAGKAKVVKTASKKSYGKK